MSSAKKCYLISQLDQEYVFSWFRNSNFLALVEIFLAVYIFIKKFF